MVDQTNDVPIDQDNAGGLKWEAVKVAEDEISELWKTTAKIETAEQAELAALRTQQDNFWPQIEALANECDALLRGLGFPDAAQRVLHLGDGEWKELPTFEEFKKTGGQVVDGRWLAENYSQGFSDPWYAGRIGFRCRIALEHFRKGDSGKPFLFSQIFEISSLRTDWRWRSGHKPSILTGKLVRKGAKLGGEMRYQNFQPDTLRRLEEMQRLVDDGKSPSRAAELAAKNGFGVTGGANRKLWDRHKKR